jgi:hypothetical protein
VLLRSVLVATQSLTLHTPGHHAELAGRHHVFDSGRTRVELPADNCMTRHLVGDGRQIAMIEVPDPAPTPVRDRIRSRVTLTGQPAPVGAGTDDSELFAFFDVLGAKLVTGGETPTVDPAALSAARPDPLAALEAQLLCHLTDSRRDVIELLAELVPPDQRHGARAVRPVRLDRLGLSCGSNCPARITTSGCASRRLPTPLTCWTRAWTPCSPGSGTVFTDEHRSASSVTGWPRGPLIHTVPGVGYLLAPGQQQPGADGRTDPAAVRGGDSHEGQWAPEPEAEVGP